MWVFYYRPVDSADQEWPFKKVKEVSNDVLKTDFDVLFAAYDQGQKGDVTQDDLRSLMCCDFVPKNDTGHYLKVKDFDINAVGVSIVKISFNDESFIIHNCLIFRIFANCLSS